MSTYLPTTTSSVAFDSATSALKQSGGTLVVAGSPKIIYTSTASAIALTSGDTETQGRDTSNQITFDQVICRQMQLTRAANSEIKFESAAAVRFSFRANPGNNPVDGLANPPTGFNLPVIWFTRTTNGILFDNLATATGGKILDESCSPPKLIPN